VILACCADKALYDESTEDVDELLTGSSSVERPLDPASASLWTQHYRSVGVQEPNLQNLVTTKML